MKGGSEDPFSTLFTGSITAKIGGSIMPIIDRDTLRNCRLSQKMYLKKLIPLFFSHQMSDHTRELGTFI